MSRPAPHSIQAGLSLVELLVALAISMVIVIAASAFFLSSSRTGATQDAAGVIQDNARFATEIITKNIQQAGYQNYIWNTAGAVGRREILPPTGNQPDVRGYNNSAAGTSNDFNSSSWGHNKTSSRVNNSDALVIRFQGSGTSGGTPNTGDGSMIDCLGRGQPEPIVSGDRAVSIFEIDRASATSEPELRCKYITSGGVLSSEPIVRGVESLQLIFGVDSNGDSVVDQWRNAEQVDNSCAGAVCLTNWATVRSVRVGMVFRSPDRVTVSTSVAGTTTFEPLAPNFSQGLSSAPDTLSASSSDGRLRKVVTFTVNLRNPL